MARKGGEDKDSEDTHEPGGYKPSLLFAMQHGISHFRFLWQTVVLKGDNLKARTTDIHIVGY